MVQQLRALPVFAEDLELAPSTAMEAHDSVTPVPGGQTLLSGFCRNCMHIVHLNAHKQTLTHTGAHAPTHTHPKQSSA